MSSNKAKTVLVAGGAGYIGTHTAVELIRAGYDVVIADNLSNSDLSAVKGVEAIVGRSVPFVQVDCCDREAMREQVFSRYAFDSVIHFAAYKAVGESVAEPLKYFRNNLDSLLTVMDLMQEFEVPNLVFSSSATVYGQPEVLPATEQTPRQRANSPYGLTKQMSEDIIQDTVSAVPFFKAIALRYFNPIGAHPSALIGELPKGVPNNLVPFITQTAAGIRKELSVFGDDYDTPDGSCLRDYIDVVDLARAHVVAVDRMVGGRSAERFEIFNIGTGTPVSVLELVRLFEEVNGVPVPHRIAARRPGDVEKIWAATDKANDELGWRAERDLGDTLRAAWAWEKHVRGL
ncbi:UDP-glucose 4-epimerase GalE [uncultured Rikenella sp.]|uniref:UDP-glucose 4-epimerase GalE n=1 Tax=uncultured Rikenella sp. TaxID=368003 RepID=UPI0025D6892B|nr:UDP-glucose 4-epimerase GalE [uncultured Rikenella sp.]